MTCKIPHLESIELRYLFSLIGKAEELKEVQRSDKDQQSSINEKIKSTGVVQVFT